MNSLRDRLAALRLTLPSPASGCAHPKTNREHDCRAYSDELLALVSALAGKCEEQAKVIANLSMGLRMLKAYPNSRNEQLGKLLDYCQRNGVGGSPLRDSTPPAAAPTESGGGET